MADFDPGNQQAPQQEGTQVKHELKQGPAPAATNATAQSGNKLTRATSHLCAWITYVIIKAFPIIYGVVTIFITNIGAQWTYIAYAVCLALDFYNTKNFAGRYLAQLRWATYIVEGKQYYYFESMNREEVKKFDSVTFWIGLWFTPMYFIALGIGYIFLFQIMDIPIMIVGAISGIYNLIMYLRASKDAKKKMQEMGANLLSRGVAFAAQQYAK